jgi:hypothetical protein
MHIYLFSIVYNVIGFYLTHKIFQKTKHIWQRLFVILGYIVIFGLLIPSLVLNNTLLENIEKITIPNPEKRLFIKQKLRSENWPFDKYGDISYAYFVDKIKVDNSQNYDICLKTKEKNIETNYKLWVKGITIFMIPYTTGEIGCQTYRLGI